MRIAGIVLTILGGLMALGGLNSAFNESDLNSSHDLSKLLGGLGFSALVFLGGIAMIGKSGSRR